MFFESNDYKKLQYLPDVESLWMFCLQVDLKICDFPFKTVSLYAKICTLK